jgi:uncharacterized protein YqeY
MIKQTIDQDIKTAMLSGDKRTANALRNVKSTILAAEIAAGKRDEGLPDQEVIGLLQKEQKKRIEAAELYDKGGKPEQAEEERFEKDLIQNYLPQQLSEDEINQLVDQVIAELGIEFTQQAMGRVIAGVKEKSGGAADGATVARLVKARLA